MTAADDRRGMEMTTNGTTTKTDTVVEQKNNDNSAVELEKQDMDGPAAPVSNEKELDKINPAPDSAPDYGQFDAPAVEQPSEKLSEKLCDAGSEKDAVTEKELDRDYTVRPGDVTEAEKGPAPATPPYSVFPIRRKVALMMVGSFSAMISPLSSSIYYPALDALASDMHVSLTLINLTITTYLIFQGIAPSFMGSFSDNYGRRPAFLICFSIYVCANIGLAVQNNYAALMVLRCLQSSGSSGTIAIGTAAVADLATRADRGKYIGYASMGITLGPALGPIIGGLLDHFLGWKAIFWFLVIFSGCFLTVIAIVFPETCRAVVGNGSVPPPRWDRPLIPIMAATVPPNQVDYSTIQVGHKRPNPIASVTILRDPESGLLLMVCGLMFAGYMAVVSTLSTKLASIYHFNTIQVGLCYLPFGFGSMTSRYTLGNLLDWNFRRLAARQGIRLEANRQEDGIGDFDIEAARLAVTIPFIYLGSAALVAYGWVMHFHTNLAGPLIVVFFIGNAVSGVNTSLNTLVMDLHRHSAATAIAANNLLRCLLGAAAAAVVNPLMARIGIGWTGTFVGCLWLIFSPLLWIVYFYGHRWRKSTRPDA